MKSKTLLYKLALLTIVLLLFSLVGSYLTYTSSKDLATNYAKIDEVNLPKNKTLLEAYMHFGVARMHLMRTLLPKQKAESLKLIKDQVKEELAQYDKLHQEYAGLSFGEGEEELYKPVTEKMKIYRSDIEKVFDLTSKIEGKEGPEIDLAREIAGEVMTLHAESYKKELLKLIDWLNRDTKGSSDQAKFIKSKIQNKVIIINILALIFGGTLSYLIMRRIINEQKLKDEKSDEATRSFNMVETSPTCTMMCDLNGTLLYMNKASIDHWKLLQAYIPDRAENLVGKNIDTFHKNPEVQRRIFTNPKNLPHKAVCSVGPEKVEFLITASMDKDNNFLGCIVSWSIATEKINLVRDLSKSAGDLTEAAGNMLAVSTNLGTALEKTSMQAYNASTSTEDVNTEVQKVADSMTEMVSAIKEITTTTNSAANMTTEAMRVTMSTNKIINQLGESSMDIGNVTKVISSIAEQTNLLALNATIEAARAGESGKGFAVVANEVKELAKQTAKATNEITKKIEAIQADSKNAIDAIAEISAAIEKVNGYTGTIASAIEEQAATTSQVTNTVSASAVGMGRINQSINELTEAMVNTEADIGNTQTAAKTVNDIAVMLEKYVIRLENRE